MSTATTNSLSQESAEAQKAFVEHIAELRSRAFWIAIAFIVFSSLAYAFRQPLIDLILSPLGSQQLVYLTPGGGFAFIFQITMYAGAVVTSPLIIFHLYRFIQPALPPRAQKNSFRVIMSSVILMVGGVAFGYFVAIPSALVFLTTFAGDFVSPNLTADSYLGFIMAYLAGLGILFQLPLFLIIWNWISPIPPGGLLNSQRFVAAFAFIAAAIITPTPDIVNQSLVAGPIIAIYQLGVVSVFFMNKRARKRAKKIVVSSETSKPKVGPVEEKTVKPIEQPNVVPRPILAAQTTQKRHPVMDIAAPSQAATQRSVAVKTAAPQVIKSPIKTTTHAQQKPRAAMDGFVSKTKAQPVYARAPQPVTKRPVPQLSSNRSATRHPAGRNALTAYTKRTGVVPSLAGSRRAVGLDGFSMNR